MSRSWLISSGMVSRTVASGLAALLLAPATRAEQADATPLSSGAVRADIRAESDIVQVGRPIWVDFSLLDLTGDPLTLRAPETSLDSVPPVEMGLPRGHIFSGTGGSALTVKDAYGDEVDAKVAVRFKQGVPAVRLAPFGSVGLRLDVTKYYPSLRRPGKYTLLWKPYQGALASKPLIINVMAQRQAVMTTDFGQMTMRFYYDEAPNHVKNFIELAEQGFFTNLIFHRIVPGAIIQGGDPRGDGRGIKPDGQRIKAEFSTIHFETGTIGMARSPRDPDSGSCQFFICLSRQPAFDGDQTAFGYLTGNESFETLRRIAAAPTDSKDRPRKPVYIRAISMENVPAARNEESSSPSASNAQKSSVLPHPTTMAAEADTLHTDSPALIREQADPPAGSPGTRAVWKGGARTKPAERGG